MNQLVDLLYEFAMLSILYSLVFGIVGLGIYLYIKSFRKK